MTFQRATGRKTNRVVRMPATKFGKIAKQMRNQKADVVRRQQTQRRGKQG